MSAILRLSFPSQRATTRLFQSANVLPPFKLQPSPLPYPCFPCTSVPSVVVSLSKLHHSNATLPGTAGEVQFTLQNSSLATLLTFHYSNRCFAKPRRSGIITTWQQRNLQPPRQPNRKRPPPHGSAILPAPRPSKPANRSRLWKRRFFVFGPPGSGHHSADQFLHRSVVR